MTHLITGRRPRHAQRTEHVVAHRRPLVLFFHEQDMLARRQVKYDMRRGLVEQ